MRQRFAPVLVVGFALAAVAVGLGFGPGSPATASQLATPGSQVATPAPYGSGITSTVFANAAPVAIDDPSLALALVTVAPGAPIAAHNHPGTQIGTIAAGELTYSVLTDRVEVRRAGTAPDAAPTYVEAGETAVLSVGDSVIEPPTSLHHAVNAGAEPVEIWLATLFPAGAPRTAYATPAAVAATPSP